MVIKGLPSTYDYFIVVITQSVKSYTFSEVKVAIHNFSENEKSCSRNSNDMNCSGSTDSVMKITSKHQKREIKCYGCKKLGHDARNCPTLYGSMCTIKGHNVENCCKKKNSGEQSKTDSVKLCDDSAFSMASRDSKQKVCANYPGLLIDTGAISNIVRDAEKFVSFNDNFNPDEHTIEFWQMARNHMQPNREVQQK